MAQVAIPSSPADQKKIRDVLQTISDAFTRIEAEKDLIKDEVAALAESFEIPKKYINKMARTYHKQNFDQQAEEQEDFTLLYENIVQLKKD